MSSVIQAHILAFSIIFFSAFIPFVVHGACGTIPATYPLFSGEELKLDEDISINTNPVDKDDYKPNAGIDASGNVSTNISLTLPDLDPSSFPSNSSNTDLEVENTSTINHTSEVFYDKIEIEEEDITVNFTGGAPFHIEELVVKQENITLNFAAGIYYINKFKIDDKDVTLNVTSTPVIFHIGDEFKIDGKDANINTAGNIDDFLVYLHSGAKFESKEKNLNFTGLIYGPDVDKVTIEGKDSTIHGAIIVAGGEIELKKKNISFTYTAADQTAIGNISTCVGGGGGSDTSATAFNCVENSANGITGNLYTKTTAQSFSFDIVALLDPSTIETSFASGADHTVTVELVNAETAASCDSYPVLSPAVSQSLTIASADSGTKASANITSSTAYSKVKCRVTDATNSPSVIGCSTDSFAIRPTTMTVSSNLTNTGSTGLPKAKAGDSFTLTATAATGYNGTPNINNSNIQAHAGAVQTGSISGSFSAADSATGIATGTAFSYSEVGSLRFTAQGIYDENFTAIDQANDCTDDFSNTPDADGKVGCKFGITSTSDDFGRFTPDHFKITASANGVFAETCAGFTYNGQAFSYQTAPTLTVTAYNGLGTPAVTANYTGSYASALNTTDFNVTAPTTDSAQAGADGSTLVNLESWTPGTPSLADNGDGSLTFAFGADSFIYQHESNSKIAPYTPTVDLIFTNITDSDGIQAQVLPHTIQASGTSIRFGRLNIDNAHGSELIPLGFQLTTEYYNGTNFIKNTADSCTSFTLANDFSISDLADLNCSLATNTTPVSIGSTGQVKAVMANTTVSNGATEITISDVTDVTKGPGSGNTGYVEITSNLVTNLPWLRFDWDTDSVHDNCPSARATFGIFKGNSKQIYFREVY